METQCNHERTTLDVRLVRIMFVSTCAYYMLDCVYICVYVCCACVYMYGYMCMYMYMCIIICIFVYVIAARFLAGVL